MRTSLYPLKFDPILKEKVWGGTKLVDYFKKKGTGLLGESWELSDVDGSVSEVSNGEYTGTTLTELSKEFGPRLVGQQVFQNFGHTFPLLFKFIDAREDLSVQLHPDDLLAQERHNSFGKTEMWYIMHAEDNARLILGFNREMNETIYSRYLSENRLEEILHSEKVAAGDSFFIAPGTVHAIGAGVVLAEIQQTSDITYRIYDWERPDIDGNFRELHNDLAVDAIHYNQPDARLRYTEKENVPVQLCSKPYFETNKWSLRGVQERELSTIDSFVVYMCVEGNGRLKTASGEVSIEIGETVLIPAETESVTLEAERATFLEVYIP